MTLAGHQVTTEPLCHFLSPLERKHKRLVGWIRTGRHHSPKTVTEKKSQRGEINLLPIKSELGNEKLNQILKHLPRQLSLLPWAKLHFLFLYLLGLSTHSVRSLLQHGLLPSRSQSPSGIFLPQPGLFHRAGGGSLLPH